MNKLNKQFAYGTVFGAHGIARFEQNGRLYDAQGNLLGDDGLPLAGATQVEFETTTDTGGGDTDSSESDAGGAGDAGTGDAGSGANGAGDTGSDAGTGQTNDTPLDKNALIAKAKALGINANRNWGTVKLEAAIVEAEAKQTAADDSNTDQINASLQG